MWDIILSLDKTGKRYLKDEARAYEGREKLKQKKAKKKARKLVRKEAGKKVKSDSESTASNSDRSDSDDNAGRFSSSLDPTPKPYWTNRTAGSTTRGMPEFKVLNGQRHCKSQGGK